MNIKKKLAIVLLICTLLLDGISAFIIIDDKIKSAKHANSYQGGANLSVQERQAFNRQFTQYEKKQSGTMVSELIRDMISNCNNNSDDNDKLPDLIIRVNDTNLNYVESNSKNPNVEELIKVQQKIESRHIYYVKVFYNYYTSMIDLIVVEYEKYDICDDSFEPYDKNYNLKSKDDLLSSIKLQTKENDSKI